MNRLTRKQKNNWSFYDETAQWECFMKTKKIKFMIQGTLAQILEKYPDDYVLNFKGFVKNS